MSKKVVSFHDEPPSADKTNKYKEALNRAKGNQRERPTNMQGTPRFDQTTAWSESEKGTDGNFLSPETKRGLENMAKAAKLEQKTANVSEASDKSELIEEPEEELTEEERLRKAIESRVDEIDIGEYLMAGEVRQTVPIIPDKLEIVFKTVSDLEESFVDNKISGEPTTITNRQFLRKMNELALVIHIYSVNGTKWPTLINGDGNINEDSVEARLRHIRKLSSPVFNLLTQNLSWFIERVNKGLTASALGNG